MANAVCVEEQLSLIHSRLSLRRLDDRTLKLLQSILASGDVGCQHAIRSALRSILRGEISAVLEEAASRSVDEKLRVLEFFVCAFALAGDNEKCLALRYEALLLREDGSAKLPWLKSAYDEWLTLAQDSLDNGFYSVAIKCYDSALSCISSTCALDPTNDVCQSTERDLEKVQQLRDAALVLSASSSDSNSFDLDYSRSKLDRTDLEYMITEALINEVNVDVEVSFGKQELIFNKRQRAMGPSMADFNILSKLMQQST